MRAGVVGAATMMAACGRVGFTATDDDASVLAASDRYERAVLADMPTAYWRLDETSGTVAHDLLGHYPGTFQGGCTLGVGGALSSGDKAVELDGSSCRIVIGDVLEFGGVTPFTMEMWASLAVSDVSVRWLVSHEVGSPNVGYMWAFKDTTLWFEQDSSGSALAYAQTSLPSLGMFHHVAITTNGGRQRLYVDGVMAAQTTFSVTEPSNTGPLVFGDYLETDPNKTKGTLDEIAIYAHELSASAVAAHYAAR